MQKVNVSLCPQVENAFGILSKKWTGLILNVLIAGPRHFCDLQREVPSLSARLLTIRLRELEAENIVRRVVQTQSPVRVAYELTERGKALEPVLKAIESWAHDWAPNTDVTIHN